jgi:hypothetical protein
VRATGRSSGLPQEHRTRGTPCSSTITAVPACRTDWKAFARPFRKPWLVTAVSVRRTTGVSDLRNGRIWLGRMPWARAHAAARSGWASKKAAMSSALQASARVPP